MNKTTGVIIALVLVLGAAATATALVLNDTGSTSEETVNTDQIVSKEADPLPATATPTPANPSPTPAPTENSTPSSITLNSPKAGSYLLGSEIVTSWDLKDGSGGNVTITLLNNDGSVYGTIATVAANSGKHVWYAGMVTKDEKKIPVPGDRYYKIKITYSGGGEAISAPFELAYGGPPQEAQ